ncbi:MAG TPA: ABC transporter permease subunit [Hyphomicrobiales bacterium]|nr:ABC transporter permease subunit [Hyphomicrobiales bacterium]
MIWLRRALALAIVVLLWQAVVWLHVVPERYLPSPADVAVAAVAMFASAEDMRAEMLTVGRALAGFALTVPLGIALGALGALVPAFQKALRPWTELLRPLPPAAVIPISVFAIGFGIKLYLFIIAFAGVWAVYFNTVAAFSGTSDVLTRTGRAFGCDRLALTFGVVLPSAMPQIFVGIRIAATVALIGSVVTDIFGGEDGLGYLLFERAFALRIPDVFALTLLCGVNGMLFNQMVLVLRRLVIGWHDRMNAEALAA